MVKPERVVARKRVLAEIDEKPSFRTKTKLVSRCVHVFSTCNLSLAEHAWRAGTWSQCFVATTNWTSNSNSVLP